jgi:CxxC-x17-CxxC domain-containing protein
MNFFAYISESFRKLGRSTMDFVDRNLKCQDCGGEFVFTAGEQLFFHDKQFKNDPKRCKDCKGKRSKQRKTGDGAARRSGTETRTNCSQCGVETTVPFRPTQGRPVLCRSCFQNKKPGDPAVNPPAPADGNSEDIAASS